AGGARQRAGAPGRQRPLRQRRLRRPRSQEFLSAPDREVDEVIGIVCRLRAAVVVAAAVAAASIAAAPALAASPAYVIHSNDQLNIQVFGDSTLSETTTVLPSGDIDYPLVGRIHVAGLTTGQASAAIASALKKYVRKPVV